MTDFHLLADYWWGMLVVAIVWIKRLYMLPVVAWRTTRRVTRQVGGMLDTFGGRDAHIDPVTGEHIPAVLPLGPRVGAIEVRQVETTEMLRDISQILATQHHTDARVDRIEQHLELAPLPVAVIPPH